MSQSDVEVLRKIYEAMGAGRFWDCGPYFDDDIEWEWAPPLTGLTGRTYRGIDEVAAATKDWVKAWDWFWREAEEYIEIGDHVVVVVVRQHGRLKGSDSEVEEKAADVWSIRDGKATSYKAYSDLDEAMAAAGGTR